MATLRELKTRIGSVASSEKITGAMKMISSAKVHKFERQMRELLPFKNQLQTIMGHILSAGVEFRSPLIADREVKRVGVVVYGSDDGLCGAYNLNIFKQLLVELNDIRSRYGSGVEITLYPVGKKIFKACWKLDSTGNISVRKIEGVDSKMDGAKVDAFTETLRADFTSGELDLIEVVYMRYLSISRQRLAVDQLFPVRADLLLAEGADKADENQLYIFEPDPNEIFNTVLPMYVLSMMQEITIENCASEQAARVMAMQSANDNAHKLQEQLQLEYNKLRQQSITTELLDILGGQVER
ncbi:MAG: ATP synthase F1 subunit gamma [Muribaculaceae bacterium]|nr:ATP synthase F1 subunit gamma [Muribaculaceae bacterium]MDE6329550.1 ATP synthase F1 subunit gamma [Muribaculaceae bacterium]